MDAEPSGGALDNRVLPIPVQGRMKPALTGVVKRPHLLGGPGEPLVDIEVDGAVGHGRKYYRVVYRDLGREAARELRCPVFSLDAYGIGPGAEVRAQFHRLPQRVYRRVGDLARVQEHLVPVYRVGIGVSHPGQQDAPRVGLLVDVLYEPGLPDGVVPEFGGVLLYRERPGRAEGLAPVAAHALDVIRVYLPGCLVVNVGLVRTLPLADPAVDAFVRIAFDHEVVVFLAWSTVEHSRNPFHIPLESGES